MLLKKYWMMLFISIFFLPRIHADNALSSQKIIAISYQKIIAHRDWKLTFKKAARAFKKISLKDLPKGFKVMGATLKKHFKGAEIKLDQLIQEYSFLNKYRELMYEVATAAYHDAHMIMLLEKLKAKGVLLVLATNTPADWIEYLKGHQECFKLFDLYCLGSGDFGRKPDFKYLQNLHAAVSNEDSPILIIDSDAQNVKKMQCDELNIQSIQFTTPQELEIQLIELGYL